MTKHYSDAEADIIAAAVAEAEGLRAEVARLRELAKRQRQLVSDLEGVVAGQRAVIVSLRELRSAA